MSEKDNSDLAFLVDGKKKIDLAATIAEYAIEYSDPLANKALNIFVSIYGAASSNLALTTLPFGGLYIVGNVNKFYKLKKKLHPSIKNTRQFSFLLEPGYLG